MNIIVMNEVNDNLNFSDNNAMVIDVAYAHHNVDGMIEYIKSSNGKVVNKLLTCCSTLVNNEKFTIYLFNDNWSVNNLWIFVDKSTSEVAFCVRVVRGIGEKQEIVRIHDKDPNGIDKHQEYLNQFKEYIK